MSTWENSYVKNSVLSHSLALLKTIVVLRWLIWHTQLMTKDDTNLRHSVTVAKKLSTLQNIVARNFAITDQALGLEIAKGPKVGRLFPLQSFSIPRSISVVILLSLIIAIFDIRN
ncbi:hypothetical protein LWI28_018295 [Acer negundo]|uniref:Uncharacterized protein n=1 Tax=Acer negundo TaxID=4023 RepID=A0AAD5P2D8_ACENE|nr:hypothetical protein LWI28_018295 [Acer negundo]